MRKTAGIVILGMLMAFMSLQAQNCGEFQPLLDFPGNTPTFLGLITGFDGRPDSSYWEELAAKSPNDNSGNAAQKAVFLLHAGKIDEAKSITATYTWNPLNSGSFDSLSLKENAAATEAAGLALLCEGNSSAAVEQLKFALENAPFGIRCRIKHELLVAQYLAKYQKTLPIFSGFNGGFYGFVSDSLKWKTGEPEAIGYLQALNTVAMLYRMDKKHAAIYLELLGDLLTEEPGKFNANYISALAYLRAARNKNETLALAFERKALFALEAPRDREDRFNQYRFTQIKKALDHDIDSAKTIMANINHSNSYKTPINSGFSAEEPGSLARILTKSKGQLEARATEAKRYEGDVDLKKEVKKDSRFNLFAMFLIAIIIGAVIFIVRQIRRVSAEKGR